MDTNTHPALSMMPLRSLLQRNLGPPQTWQLNSQMWRDYPLEVAQCACRCNTQALPALCHCSEQEESYRGPGSRKGPHHTNLH